MLERLAHGLTQKLLHAPSHRMREAASRGREDLLEAARGEFFRYLGKSFLEYQEEGVIFPVSEVHLKYFAFAEYDDELRIECRLTAIRGARLGFGYRITKGEGVRILEGETLHGCVEASGRATRLPPALKERLQPYLDSE